LQKIVIGEQEVLCNLVLFDLDGTLLDDKVRYAYMARARFEVISKMVGREAAVKWAALSGVDIRDFSVDRYGPLARAPRKEDIVVAACALFLTGIDGIEPERSLRRLTGRPTGFRRRSINRFSLRRSEVL